MDPEEAKIIEREKLESNLDAYNRLIIRNPNNSLAYYLKAGILRDLGRYEEALDSYNDVIRLKPDSVSAYSNKATILNSLVRHQEALDSYNQVIILEPKSIQDADYRKKTQNLLDAFNGAKAASDQVINNVNIIIHNLNKIEQENNETINSENIESYVNNLQKITQETITLKDEALKYIQTYNNILLKLKLVIRNHTLEEISDNLDQQVQTIASKVNNIIHETCSNIINTLSELIIEKGLNLELATHKADKLLQDESEYEEPGLLKGEILVKQNQLSSIKHLVLETQQTLSKHLVQYHNMKQICQTYNIDYTPLNFNYQDLITNSDNILLSLETQKSWYQLMMDDSSEVSDSEEWEDVFSSFSFTNILGENNSDTGSEA